MHYWRYFRAKLWRALKMADTFDRIEFEQEIKDCFDPKLLYQKSELLSKLKLSNKISAFEYDEQTRQPVRRSASMLAAKPRSG